MRSSGQYAGFNGLMLTGRGGNGAGGRNACHVTLGPRLCLDGSRDAGEGNLIHNCNYCLNSTAKVVLFFEIIGNSSEIFTLFISCLIAS